MRFLVADDHPIVLQGVGQILQEEYPGCHITDATRGAEVIAYMQNDGWDLVILDISLPDRNGLDVLKDIRELDADIPVLILSMHVEEQLAIRALRAGATGYVTKESASEDLAVAVERALGGVRYVSPSLAQKIVSLTLGGGKEEELGVLSDREYQVLRLLSQGKSLGAIADDLSVSIKTVSTYRARLLQKLKLRSTIDLVKYAIENHLDK
jgi:two-component system invasion response regulator UvrY